MGKAGRNEKKRTAANFLNGVAVALLVAGYLGPLLAGGAQIWGAAIAILASGGTHWLATKLAGDLED